MKCLIKIEISESCVSNAASIVYKDETLNWEKPQHTTPRSGSWANENLTSSFFAGQQEKALLVWYLPGFLQEMSFLLSYSSSIPQQLVTIVPDIYTVYIVLKV